MPRATKRPRKESTHKITPAQAAELDAVEKESVRKARLITIGRGRKRVTLEGEGGESDAEEEFDPLALYALTGAVLSTKLRVASRRTDNGTENHTVVANGPVAWTAVPRPPHDYIDPSERYTCVGEPPKDIVIFEEVDGRLISEKILELMRSAVSGTVPTETTLSGWVRIFSAAWQKEWWELPAFSRAAYRTLSPNTVVQPTLIRVIENHVASTTNELLPMAERLNSGVPSALDDMRTAVGLTSHAPHLATSVVSALPKSMQTVLRSDPHLDRVKTPLTLFTSMARLYDARNGTAFNQVVTAGLNSFQNLMDMCLNTRTGARLDRCPHGRARPKCSLCQIVAEATTNYLSMGTHLPLYEARLSTRASIFAGTPQPEWKDIAAGVRWEDGVGPIDLFRPAAHLIGIGNIAQLPVPVAANATNLTTALRNRFIHDIPLHDPKVWQKFEEFVEHNRERLLPGLKPQPPIPFEQWVSNFPPYKRERLRKAKAQIDTNTARRPKVSGVFTKWEKTMMSVDQLPMLKVPRPIVPWADTLNVDLGPFIHGAYQQVKSIWHPQNWLTYGAGLDGIELGAWFKPLYPNGDDFTTSMQWVKFDNDMTTYDRCQHSGCFHLAEKVFQWAGISGAAASAYRTQFQTELRSRYGHLVSLWYNMKSGVPNTALQNTILNILMHAFVYSVVLRLPVSQLRHVVRILGNGDDNISMVKIEAIHAAGHTPATFQARCDSLFRQLGMLPKMNVRADHEMQVNGCNLTFAQVAGMVSPVATPMLGRLGPKLAWSIDAKNNSPEWLNGVVEGTHRLTRVVPFLRHWVIAQHTPGVGTSVVQMDHKYRVKSQLEMCPASYTMELWRSGMGDWEEAQFATWLSEVRKPALVAHPVFEAHRPYA